MLSELVLQVETARSLRSWAAAALLALAITLIGLVSWRAVRGG